MTTALAWFLLGVLIFVLGCISVSLLFGRWFHPNEYRDTEEKLGKGK